MMVGMMVSLGILGLGLLLILVGLNSPLSLIQVGIGIFLAVLGAAGFLLSLKR